MSTEKGQMGTWGRGLLEWKSAEEGAEGAPLGLESPSLG